MARWLATFVLVALGLWLAPPARADLLWPARVPAAEFASLLRAEVARAYGVSPEAVDLQGLPAQGGIPLPAGLSGKEVLRVRDATVRSLAGRTSLPVDILEGGQLKRLVALPVKVTVYVDAVVVKRRVLRGTPLSDSDVALERRPVHAVTRGTYRKLDDVVGQEALMDLSPGTAVTSYVVRGTPGPGAAVASARAGGVRSGTEVTVRVQVDGLSLTGKGRVLESGDVGDEVRVKLLNFANSKIIKARVFSSQEVRVNMEEMP